MAKKKKKLRDVSTCVVLKAMRLVEIPSFEEKRGPKSELWDTLLFRRGDHEEKSAKETDNQQPVK